MTGVDLVHLPLVQIDADRRQPGARELDRERQADIAETDDAGARLSRF